jgi:hypothetical protein
MQIACHRCGAMLEEGTAFCPACGAPQIRVNSDQPASPPLPPGTPGNLQPPATPVGMPGSTRIDWSAAFKVTLITGAVAAIPSSIPVASALCCLWLVGGAALTVKMYQRSRPGLVTTGMGARLGAVMGLCTFGFWLVFRFIVESARGGFTARMMQELQRSAAANPDPNVQQVVQKLNTPEGIAIFVTMMAVIMLFSFVIFGIIGGAIGASVWGRRSQG